MTNASSSAKISSTKPSENSLREKVQSNESTDVRNRERIALGVLIVSLLAVLGISITVIFTAKNDNRETLATRVLDSTLPLYGTWVGTILAFYFSRNAFEAASNSAIRIQQGASGSISVPSPNDTLNTIELKSLENGLIFSLNDLHKPLQEVVVDLENKGRYRIIVLNANNQFVDLIYRINAETYLKTPPGTDPDSPTVSEYLDWRNSQGENAKPTVVFLPESATLADAYIKMTATMGCRDVIVTVDGKDTNPVIVYVTDYDIEQYQ